MIHNKNESLSYIRKRNLNRPMQKVFQPGDTKGVKEFLAETNLALYSIRTMRKGGGFFAYAVESDNVASTIAILDQPVWIGESFYVADMYLVLQGELLISKDLKVLATLSDRPCTPLRRMIDYDTFKVCADLLYESEPSIPGLKEAINYCIRNNLVDSTVEFTLYDRPVGINRENIIIWEVRNY